MDREEKQFEFSFTMRNGALSPAFPMIDLTADGKRYWTVESMLSYGKAIDRWNGSPHGNRLTLWRGMYLDLMKIECISEVRLRNGIEYGFVIILPAASLWYAPAESDTLSADKTHLLAAEDARQELLRLVNSLP